FAPRSITRPSAETTATLFAFWRRKSPGLASTRGPVRGTAARASMRAMVPSPADGGAGALGALGAAGGGAGSGGRTGGGGRSCARHAAAEHERAATRRVRGRAASTSEAWCAGDVGVDKPGEIDHVPPLARPGSSVGRAGD